MNNTIQYKRRATSTTKVGNQLCIGSSYPIVVQSMTNVDTNNITAGVEQTIRIHQAGGQLVRFTAQGTREAKALGEVAKELQRQGYTIPLVADIHFNPKAAYEAATQVEKVRINPGNFYDPPKRFEHHEYTHQEYQAEVTELQANFLQFLEHCKAHNTALRIGVNHGSLSDRIMARYGDTPLGMVESCLEYLQVCQRANFLNVVISIKASNPLVMVETVKLLVQRMEALDMHYPLHLGVTEAGDGEDGRVKSALGIGALLAEGIGDTIRVSLSEEPEAEIPVANRLVQLTEQLQHAPSIQYTPNSHPTTRSTGQPLVVQYATPELNQLPPELRPDLLLTTTPQEAKAYPTYHCVTQNEVLCLTDTEALQKTDWEASQELTIIELTHPNPHAMLQALASTVPCEYIIAYKGQAQTAEHYTIDAAYHLGATLLRGEGKGVLLHHPLLSPSSLTQLTFSILQASRRRISRTEFISCPGCGRTLFNLQETVASVKKATAHLKGLKIGIMGCIVNGPGEMADADYGYVGAGPKRIDLYKGKEKIMKGVPQEQAVEKLIELIKLNGDWQEPSN